MAVNKKILIVNDMARGGGVEILIQSFCRQWEEIYDLTLLTFHPDEDAASVYPKHMSFLLYDENFSYPGVLGKLFLKPKVQKTVKKIRDFFWQKKLSNMGFDVVLAMKEGPITIFCAGIKAEKKLGWVHLDYHNAYWTGNLYRSKEQERELLERYSNIVCVSEYIASSIRDVIGDPGNLIVKYNPIDTQLILRNAREDAVDIPAKGERTRFVTVGRMHYQKGYDLLLDACRILKDRGFSFEMIICGGGPEEESLKEKSKELGLDQVLFMGDQANPHKYLKTADWFVSSSRYEGYSLVSQEAAVLGIPIIATDCSGVRELLGQNEEYGMICAIDANAIADRMQLVIGNRELREEYRKKIVQRSAIINNDQRICDIEMLFG